MFLWQYINHRFLPLLVRYFLKFGRYSLNVGISICVYLERYLNNTAEVLSVHTSFKHPSENESHYLLCITSSSLKIALDYYLHNVQIS